MVDNVAVGIRMDFGFPSFPFRFCNIVDAVKLLGGKVLQVDDVKEILRPDHVREVVMLAQGVDHGATRPSILVRVVTKLDKFVKNIGELFGFVVDCDIPCGGITIKCGKEFIKLLGGPAWVRECCAQSSCVLYEFTLPVKWVISCPFLVNGGTLDST